MRVVPGGREEQAIYVENGLMISDFGYVRIGCAVPEVRAGAVAANVSSICSLAGQAAEQKCDLVVFPELCIAGYTCADLFGQGRLLAASLAGLQEIAVETASLPGVFVVGLPISWRGRLFNAAAVLSSGSVLGLVPKTYLPTYHEYYEARWFCSGTQAFGASVLLGEEEVLFGPDLLFEMHGDPTVVFGIEICEDLWAPIPPSCHLALAGATVIVNPSASNDLVGKSTYRHDLVRQQSARCLAAYAYCSAGLGESTTDLVFGGDCMVAENGAMLARGERFRRTPELIATDVDIAFLDHERRTNTTFEAPRAEKWSLRRQVQPRPFIPADAAQRHDRCQEIFSIQSGGLATRLHHTGIRDVVIGLSGGLDSTLALLVCLDAFESLDLDRAGIHAITMPGFGTSERTLANVNALCEGLGIDLETIAIGDSCTQHFRDIGHDGETADVTYENVQARERTQVLMDKANMLGALVIGTGDLSELALGWCTYNGDHMSMYAVNTGVPKTLVRYLIDYYAEDKAADDTAHVLRDVLDTPISPELLPPDEKGDISQKTEDVIGPYELHDFFLYHAVRCGFPPPKVLFLAQKAFPDQYSEDDLRHWLRVFYKRFFGQQFKRSCLPDGPKVGTIALSPRGDWRMPSDASVQTWLADI
jgi:NAD+ synthase (glutamine-hydrolysing)